MSDAPSQDTSREAVDRFCWKLADVWQRGQGEIDMPRVLSMLVALRDERDALRMERDLAHDQQQTTEVVKDRALAAARRLLDLAWFDCFECGGVGSFGHDQDHGEMCQRCNGGGRIPISDEAAQMIAEFSWLVEPQAQEREGA